MDSRLVEVDLKRGTLEAEATFCGKHAHLTLNGCQTIFGGCCSWCMLYLVYTVPGVNLWSWHGQILRDNLTLYSAKMVELWTGKRHDG